MIEEVFITQGEDIDGELTIYQKEGPVLDMSIAAEIYLYIHDGYKKEHAKFKAGTAYSGWYLINATDAGNGILKFKILSVVTKFMKPGKYYMEPLIRYNDADRPDDFRKDIAEEGQYQFTIKESQIQKLPLLP